jgi:hypothetical protein
MCSRPKQFAALPKFVLKKVAAYEFQAEVLISSTPVTASGLTLTLYPIDNALRLSLQLLTKFFNV